MLKDDEVKILNKYVNEEKYDIKRLMDYLERNEIIGNEIFTYIVKEIDEEKQYEGVYPLSDNILYNPVDRQTFLRRVPFYFYEVNYKEIKKDEMLSCGNLKFLIYKLFDANEMDFKNHKIELEKLYVILEKLFYKEKIDLITIMNYFIHQTKHIEIESFFQWVDYINIVNDNQLPFSKTPKCFMTDYNKALEAIGKNPIIYDIDFEVPYWNDCFKREDNTIDFSGTFPMENDEPALKWIGVNFKNIGGIKFYNHGKFSGTLRVKLLPDSIIHVRDDAGAWRQIYVGPQKMFFDHAIFKTKREQLKFTQQYIADAIQTSVRTYQKWENGETIPDGNNVIRLMNILDIDDMQLLIKYLEE